MCKTCPNISEMNFQEAVERYKDKIRALEHLKCKYYADSKIANRKMVAVSNIIQKIQRNLLPTDYSQSHDLQFLLGIDVCLIDKEERRKEIERLKTKMLELKDELTDL